MASNNRLSKALSLVLRGGALGASFVLALTSAEATAKPVATVEPAAQQSVAGRLREIRAGISEISGTEGSSEPEAVRDAKMTPTWWGNGGWGRWHPGWGNGWHNGGWGNGWHNGGWGNGGWPNWHNGWHNFWHNW